MQLVSKISNLCDSDPPTSQTDRQTQTTFNLNTELCTSASRGKNNMQTLGRPNRYSCERQQSVQFDEAKSLTNRKTNTEIAEVGQPTEKYASMQCRSRDKISNTSNYNNNNNNNNNNVTPCRSL